MLGIQKKIGAMQLKVLHQKSTLLRLKCREVEEQMLRNGLMVETEPEYVVESETDSDTSVDRRVSYFLNTFFSFKYLSFLFTILTISLSKESFERRLGACF